MDHSESEGLADTLVDAISGLAHEIGRRVAYETHMRTEDWLREESVHRAVHVKAQGVLIDYFLGKFKPASYIIAADGNSITCVRCGLTSYNANDVAQRYCAKCKLFHKEKGILS
jgi:hypothetical protein